MEANLTNASYVSDKGKVRTRFAPSPTGYMHIGNLRTALYEYLIAKRHGGTFILRIEDTDQERQVEGTVDVIYNTLKMAGLMHDEGPDAGGEYGPYVQSERKDIYRKYAEVLVESGHAYYCFCSKERLAELKASQESSGHSYKYDRRCLGLSKDEADARKAECSRNNSQYVIRQKMPDTGTTTFTDSVYGDITIDNSELDDQILIKSDGLPTYNFANVVDDHLMKITHVVRGNEYLSSTPKYNLLYKAFGWEIPTYVHVPLILDASGRKLSKRLGDPSFEDLVSMGYLVEAIVNYVVLLGWSPKDNRELFALSDLVESFDISGINKAPAVFDMNKMRWFNAEYIRKMPREDFCRAAMPYLEAAGAIKNKMIDMAKVSGLLQNRTEVMSEINTDLGFFDELPPYDAALYEHKKSKSTRESSLEMLKVSLEVLLNVGEWTEEAIRDALMQRIAELGIKNSQLFWPLRIAVSGREVTPGGATEIADILGCEETLRRVRAGIDKLQN